MMTEIEQSVVDAAIGAVDIHHRDRGVSYADLSKDAARVNALIRAVVRLQHVRESGLRVERVEGTK